MYTLESLYDMMVRFALDLFFFPLVARATYGM